MWRRRTCRVTTGAAREGHDAVRPTRSDRLARIIARVEARDLPAALDEARAAVACYPADPVVQMRLGWVLRLSGRIPEAADVMEAAFAAHPQSVVVGVEMVHVLRLTDRSEKAVALAARLLDLDPGHRGALLARVEAFVSLGDLPAALEAAETAAQVLPDNPALNIRRGHLMRRLGRAPEAVTLLTTLAALHPSHTGVQAELAHALGAAGQSNAALAAADSVLMLNPWHRAARNVRAGVLAKSADAVLIAAEIASLASPRSPEDRRTCAMVLTRLLPALPGASGLDSYLAALPLLLDSVAELSADQIVSLCSGAAANGLSQAYAPIAARLGDLPEIGPQAAEQCISLIHSHGLDNPALVQRLLNRVPEVERGSVELFALSLFEGAGAALAARRGLLPRRRSVREIAHLALLLTRDGRRRVAARYLSWALRAYPRDPTLFARLVSDLIHTGQADRAQTLLSAWAESLTGPDDPLHLRVIAGRLHLGDLSALDGLVAAADTSVRVRQMLMGQLRGLVVLGRADEAATLLRSNGLAHAIAGLNGTLIAEAMTGVSPSTADAMRALYLQRDVLKVAAAQQAGTVAIPRHVFQYWDTPDPPADLLPILSSWQNRTDLAVRRFDRQSARCWLQDRLGDDWRRAFDRAGGATEESDFLRLCLLMEDGGVYVDADDRLTGCADALWLQFGAFTAWMEPNGAAGNNVMAAMPRHPVVIRAALWARAALYGYSSENTWFKTGPGLLTRSIARQVAQAGTEGIVLHPQWRLGEQVQFHTPLPYKRAKGYWNAQKSGHGLVDLFRGWSNEA